MLASQFINEEFAHRAGMPDRQIGLGDAYEIDPDLQDGFLYQVAQAQLARQIFPHAPLKYMPPTKHMTGDIFKGHLIDAMFNLDVGDDGPDHPPLRDADRSDSYAVPGRPRAVARERAVHHEYCAAFRRRDRAQPGGIDRSAARSRVLADCETLLAARRAIGLMDAIEAAIFADVSRPPDGGRGFDGVFARAPATGTRSRTRFVAELALERARAARRPQCDDARRQALRRHA